VRRIKIERGDRLTSVLKLYESEAAARRQPEFKICENDHLVEPFELLELFTLAEAELRRLSKDREVLSRQLHLKFMATPEGLGKAGKIVDAVLRQRFALQDDATAFFAAVKEAMDNAAVHGNRSDTARRVDLHLLVDQRKATVIVEDEGGGFDHEYYLSRLGDQETFERAKRRILEENERGGLGILLMAKCADRLEYSGKGNVVRLEKNL
jgi:serine/threonine-protein kinase RsbW